MPATVRGSEDLEYLNQKILVLTQLPVHPEQVT